MGLTAYFTGYMFNYFWSSWLDSMPSIMTEIFKHKSNDLFPS